MSVSEKKAKRTKALYKLSNQLSVLSRTGTKKQQKTISQMVELFGEL